MSRDDDSMGWSGADKSPLVVVRQQSEGNPAVAATRTAGSLILILFMLVAVILAVLSITMHNIYESDLKNESVKGGADRQIVIYRNVLDEARRQTPIVQPAPTVPAAFADIDALRADNTTLRVDNRARANAAANANRPRPEPDFNRRPNFLCPPGQRC